MKDLPAILWSERTRDEFAAWAKRGAVVIVPIGSIEQHGLHLPIDTDCRTVEHVARLGARLAEDVPVLVTPTVPFGVSPHHMVYGGTISLRVETLLHVLEDVCGAIVAHGFGRILILSGHGGNAGTVGAAALELSHRLRCVITALAWWDLIPQVIEETREGPAAGIAHAGEMETSTILHLAPEAVRREKLELVPGISDDPTLGTAAKGQRVLDAAAEALAKLVREMHAAPSRPVGIRMVRV